jgi:hypothetical protein
LSGRRKKNYTKGKKNTKGEKDMNSMVKFLAKKGVGLVKVMTVIGLSGLGAYACLETSKKCTKEGADIIKQVINRVANK